jgi:hypothetical protein
MNQTVLVRNQFLDIGARKCVRRVIPEFRENLAKCRPLGRVASPTTLNEIPI